ncbi:MAG: hypothetical protein ABR538_14865 [Candidatus Binatia bacterium]
MQRKTFVFVLGMMIVSVHATAATAACPYNTPGKAGGLKTSFVRAFAQCPSVDHPSSNTDTDGGTEACSPPLPESIDGISTNYNFSPSGSCSLSIKAKLVKDCGALTNSSGFPLGLQTGPCHVGFLKAKCSGILRPDGIVLIDDTQDHGFALSTLTRWTLVEPINGQMTVIDFPITYVFSEPNKGKIDLASSTAEALLPLVGANSADLPPCTTAELLVAVIKDPAGLPFARMGYATVAE